MTNCTGRLDEVRAASRSNWKSDSVIVSAGVRRVEGFQTGLSWIPACQTAFYAVLISRGQSGGGNSPPSSSSSRLLPSIPPLAYPTYASKSVAQKPKQQLPEGARAVMAGGTWPRF